MGKIRSNIDSIAVLSVASSVVVGLVLYQWNVSAIDSFQVSLLVAALGLLIDILTRLRRGNERLLRSLQLDQAALGNRALSETIPAIVSDYPKILQAPLKTFGRKAEHELVRCADVIHALSEGEMHVEITSPFTFGRSVIDETKSSFLVVQAIEPIFWRSELGAKYLQANAALAARNVRVTRVLIIEDDVAQKYEDLIQMQVDAGIEVLIVKPESVAPEMRQEYGIVDGEILVKLLLSGAGEATAETISVRPADLTKMQDNFDLLVGYSIPAKTVLARIAGEDSVE